MDDKMMTLGDLTITTKGLIGFRIYGSWGQLIYENGTEITYGDCPALNVIPTLRMFNIIDDEKMDELVAKYDEG